MRVLVWDVHGGYTDALLHVPYTFCYLRDETAGRWSSLTGSGLGRLGSARPANATEIGLEQLRDEPPDVVLAQRMDEVEAVEKLLRRRPGRDVGAVFLEHNTPKGALASEGSVPNSRHPLADRPAWPIVHVTPFNQLFWDCGTTPTRVIEHGLPDPGHRYRGELDRLAFVINEPVRRWRVTGTDLLPAFAELGVDAYGIDGDRLPAALGPAGSGVRFDGNLSPAELDERLVARRGYLHLTRWTSLGLSLINAMLLGLPVVALGTTEAHRAVPPDGGFCSTDVAELVDGARQLSADVELARSLGANARRHALEHYRIDRFVSDWRRCLDEAAR